MSFSAKILADSVSPDGARLTTMEVTFPRLILAEFNTHRMFSRNSASSRAIPVEKMIRMVLENPYIPTHWGKNQKGMQAEEEVGPTAAADAERWWLHAKNQAIEAAQALQLKCGIHKQITNRLLEPFMWHTVIVTATEWDNFFHLRNNAQAHPDIQTIARMMQKLYESHSPDEVPYGGWHIPLINPVDVSDACSRVKARDVTDAALVNELLVKVSVARCARVSYLTHDGKRDIQADLDLHDRLLESGHLSPFEHVARPVGDYLGTWDQDLWMARQERLLPSDIGRVTRERAVKASWFGNLRGWVSARKLIPNEADILGAAK